MIGVLPSLWDIPPHTETLLVTVVTALPTIIAAITALIKVTRASRKIDDLTHSTAVIQKQTNGNHVALTRKVDYLASRLSNYETLPDEYKVVDNEGNSQPSSSHRGGSDASGPSSQQGGNQGPV